MVVDSRPDLRGVNACERLTEADIPCSYVYINSATYVMKDQVGSVSRQSVELQSPSKIWVL